MQASQPLAYCVSVREILLCKILGVVFDTRPQLFFSFFLPCLKTEFKDKICCIASVI